MKKESIVELEKRMRYLKQREGDVLDENIEEELNKRALKIGRKVFDEVYLHGEDKIEVSIRKSFLFGWSVVDVGVHSVTGLFDSEIDFIRKNGLREKNLNDFEIKEKGIIKDETPRK